MRKNPTPPVMTSEVMKKVERQVLQIAQKPTTVLLLGETGVGKNVIAEEILKNSARSCKIFLTLNCATISEELIESVLFGYVKGAYTGATEGRSGFFEDAHEGTLFIDEVGELSPKMQMKVLRVLDNGEFTRMGSTMTQRADVRVIAATNRDLEKLVAEGRFRLDLYFRLNIFPIHIPPLRDRRDEIPELVKTFIDEINETFKKEKASFTPVEGITEDARKYLQSEEHYWLGNVRELRNKVESAMVRTTGTGNELKRTDFHVAVAGSQDLSETLFERFISEKGISREDIRDAYAKHSKGGGGRGSNNPLALERTVSALLSQELTVAGLSAMETPKRTEMGYVGIGSIDYFVRVLSEPLFGETYTTVKFMELAIKTVEQQDNDSVDDAAERENANDPL